MDRREQPPASWTARLRGQIPPRDGWGLLVRRKARFGKFVLVGGLNTFISYLVFSLLLFITHADNLSVVLTWVAGIVVNFFLMGRLVFDNRDIGRLLPFVGLYLVNMLVNLASINVLTALGLGALVAQAISLPAVVLISYVVNANLVFRSASSPREGPGTFNAP